MSENWKDYQDNAAEFFRSLGLSAETDVSIKGVRTSHDVDVVVRSKHVGFETLWLVECKLWKSPVSKLHILALREIVHDTGADRGIVLSESGFQSGAVEAANLTNVQVTSLAKLTEETSQDVFAMRLRELFDRMETCRETYWEMDKGYRIEQGLRPETGGYGYSAIFVMDTCKELLSRAIRGRFPVEPGTIPAMFFLPDLPATFRSAGEVVEALEPHMAELEAKLATAKARLHGTSEP
ncbi:restriction endonuclease [Sinisalibacter aestuarii]|uniref:Restriction endonuclease type IV Mrr domain-containing protein n=1 Tax=Sinisalibacter aestuarii TaxID=2949426 RepID=A0ABQ5LT03_9RHOB|nr:restriction endonuclease [Sinisalibacter aestuarii]GKY88124.1 hypothetical protein STA1M1_19930 [Sinisalibacter aestuarii]